MIPGKRPASIWAAVSLAVLVAGGCHVTGPDFCFQIDAPCSYSGEEPLRYYVTGFPVDWVDTSDVATSSTQRLTMRPGDRITLYLVHLTGQLPGKDTVRSVAWTISNDSAARIMNGAAGTGILTAVHVGTAGTLMANGTTYQLRTCSLDRCYILRDVEVVSP